MGLNAEKEMEKRRRGWGEGERVYEINGVDFRLLDLDKAYGLMKKDILHNRSRNLCTYEGQEE